MSGAPSEIPRTDREEDADPWLRCSPRQRAARRDELAALARRLGEAASPPVNAPANPPAAAPAIDPPAVLRELRALLARPCLFHVAVAAPLPSETTAAELLLAARRGLFSALSLTTAFSRWERGRYLVLPPEIGPALDERARAQLAPWRCGAAAATAARPSPTAADACARAAAYQARAAAAFDAEEQSWAAPYRVTGAPAGFFTLPAELCDGTHPRDGAPTSFEHWVACIGSRTPRTLHYAADLALRAPDRGWLILRGRRGHYQFSDELRAYDLATGAAYVARRDGVLFSERVKITAASYAGRAAPEAIRELAFTLLTRPALTELRRATYFAELPASLPPRAAAGPPPYTVELDARKVRNSSQTTLAFTFFDGELRQDGSFWWPRGDAFDNHVVALIAAVEKDLAQAGAAPAPRGACAPARLPPAVELRGRPGAVSSLDATPRERSATAAALDRQLESLRGRACKGAR